MEKRVIKKARTLLLGNAHAVWREAIGARGCVVHGPDCWGGTPNGVAPLADRFAGVLIEWNVRPLCSFHSSKEVVLGICLAGPDGMAGIRV